MRCAGVFLSGVGGVKGEEDKGNYKMASAPRTANRRTANSGWSIWCAGLSCLYRSSNHASEIDQGNQMNQLPATCCTGYLFLFVTTDRRLSCGQKPAFAKPVSSSSYKAVISTKHRAATEAQS